MIREKKRKTLSYKAILVALWDKARKVLMPDWVKSWIMTFAAYSISFLVAFFFLNPIFTKCTNPNKNCDKRDFKFGWK